jgi:hypothetical protein
MALFAKARIARRKEVLYLIEEQKTSGNRNKTLVEEGGMT